MGLVVCRIDGCEPKMIQPQRAPVTPRVLSPDTGDVIPLEEAILPWVGKSEGAIEIVGGPGSGKTTALCHLAAVTSPDTGMLFLDEPDPARAAREAADRVVVYTSSIPHISVAAESFYLASWTDDELIEYLLAVHPDQCGSVMSRVGGAAYRRRLSGIPQLWRIVLDEMARDPAVTDVREALRRHWRTCSTDEKTRQSAGLYCLAALESDNPEAARSVLRLVHLDRDTSLVPLLRHRVMSVLVAGDLLASQLTASTPHLDFLQARLPRDLVEETAAQVGTSRAASDRLSGLVAGSDRSLHAMAASILHAAGRGWKPEGDRPPCLEGAYLRGASWPGVSLSQADLRGADLTAADLTGAKLDGAVSPRTCFRHAVLHRASLGKLNASGADFTDANLSEAAGPTSQFRWADFNQANLEAAVFTNADFRETKLVGTRFRRCDLRHAKFLGALVDGTDFTEANLRWASFRGSNFQTAVLAGACMVEVDFTACNLEYVDLPEANLEGAYLVGAYLTGSSMPRANLRSARLRGAGLACVNWEGVDLRDADMRQCSFHLGSSRSGRVDSPIASEGSRTGFYTDEFDEQYYKSPEEVRKANLRGADLCGARIDRVDFYLVDVRDVRCTIDQYDHFRRCGAILYDRG